MHYNEFQAVRMARELIEQDDEDEDEEEEEKCIDNTAENNSESGTYSQSQL